MSPVALALLVRSPITPALPEVFGRSERRAEPTSQPDALHSGRHRARERLRGGAHAADWFRGGGRVCVVVSGLHGVGGVMGGQLLASHVQIVFFSVPRM